MTARARQLNGSVRKARIGATQDPDNDHPWVPPLVAPRVPQRLYFLFGKPITFGAELVTDRGAALAAYAGVRAGVEDGIGYLLRKRVQDPYSDFFARWLHENPPMGGKRKAPSFKP
ncbi:hypothetical protein FOA52_012047 [Chlamydomonas sp. UWO 241]|nr:hypothetical protein FOA52_012047 [Chlamydomonas sp. UWO 241]